VRGPGLADVDLSLLKDFNLGESKRLQFRIESFNVANHANFYLRMTTWRRRRLAGFCRPVRRGSCNWR